MTSVDRSSSVGQGMDVSPMRSLQSELAEQASEWIAILVWVVLAGGALLLTSSLRGTAQFGPGPAFFATYLSLALLLLAAVRAAWLFRAAYRSATNADTAARQQTAEQDIMAEELPVLDWTGGAKFLLLIATLFAYALLLETIGFTVSTAVLTFTTMFVLGRVWYRALIESVIGALVLRFAFTMLLSVPLPPSSFPFLRSLGL